VKSGSRIIAFKLTDWFVAFHFTQFGYGTIINMNPSPVIPRTTIHSKIIWKEMDR